MTADEKWRIVAYDRIPDIYAHLADCCGRRPMLCYSADGQYCIACPICRRETPRFARGRVPEMIDVWNGDGENHGQTN